jgi:hypothetical protein
MSHGATRGDPVGWVVVLLEVLTNSCWEARHLLAMAQQWRGF